MFLANAVRKIPQDPKANTGNAFVSYLKEKLFGQCTNCSFESRYHTQRASCQVHSSALSLLWPHKLSILNRGYQEVINSKAYHWHDKCGRRTNFVFPATIISASNFFSVFVRN